MSSDNRLEHAIRQAIARLYILKDPLPPGGLRQELADLMAELQLALAKGDD